MPKGRPNKTHITAVLRDREGEVIVPIQGAMLHRKCGYVDDRGLETEKCEHYLVTLANSHYWNISQEEYERLKPILA